MEAEDYSSRFQVLASRFVFTFGSGFSGFSVLSSRGRLRPNPEPRTEPEPEHELRSEKLEA
jgi:hypothetical protein